MKPGGRYEIRDGKSVRVAHTKPAPTKAELAAEKASAGSEKAKAKKGK